MWWVLVGAVLQSVMPQAPGRDAGPPQPGTAIIRGRVTDKETGVAMPRVTVQLASPAPGWKLASALTDADGRYELTQVPAGTYTVLASVAPYRASHLPQIYGEATPFNPLYGVRSRPGTVVVSEGATREGIDIALTRAIGISGRVVDDTGEPMANVRVRVESLGESPWGTTGAPRETDDHGAFRLFGLGPGSYRVCATPNRSMNGPAETLLPSCYPADDQPSGLVLSSIDPPEIEIRIRRSRTYAISGIIADPSGTAADQADLTLVRDADDRSYGLIVRPGGRFSASGLLPGEYLLVARTGYSYDPLQKREHQIGVLPFRIQTANIDGLVVTLAKGAKVTGRVIPENGALPTGSRLVVQSHLLDGRFNRNVPAPEAAVSEGLAFELGDLFGPVRLTCSGLPGDWIVKAVRYGDRDITEEPTEFPSGASRAIEIVISSRGAVVSGSVSDPTGARVTGGAYVVLLPVDASADARPEPIQTPVSSTGTFRIPAQRPGEYWVLAVDSAQLSGALSSRSARLSKVAERVALSEGERRTIDLRVVKLPEDR